MLQGGGSTYSKRLRFCYVFDLRVSDQMTLLAIHHVQPRTGRLHLVTWVIEKLDIPGDLVHTMHDSSVADAVNHLTVAEFVMQRVPCISYVSIMVMSAGAMLHETRGVR